MVNVSLAIPADKEQMELAKKELGIQEFSECQWNQYGGPLDELRHYLPVGSKVEELNRFAWFLKDKVMDGTEQIVEKLKAVLTAECPRSLDEAMDVLSDLDHYQVLSEFRTPEDYARWRMKDDGSLYVSRFCEAYLDWNSLGKALMKRMEPGGRNREPCCVMSGIAMNCARTIPLSDYTVHCWQNWWMKMSIPLLFPLLD